MRSSVSPENQGVTFVELFFDLAFVFAVTKTVSLFHDGYEWATITHAVLTFWLVWWTWTQFTWTLNAADTTHGAIVAVTLLATAIAFFMAVEVPSAFDGRGMWFAIPYVTIRVLGLTLYLWVASANRLQRRAVQTFAIVSISGLVAVVAGAIAGGPEQVLLWGLALFLDVIALVLSAQSDAWDIHPAHFCERHALFIIIALGETLIVAAVGMKVLTKSPIMLAVGILTIATTCGMWWLYFARIKRFMDRAMENASGAKLAAMARDAYSLSHFLILSGIVSFAIAIEHAFHYPSGALGIEVRVSAALAVILYGVGTVLAFYLTTRRLLLARLVFALVTFGAIVFLSSIEPVAVLVVAFVAIIAVGLSERKMLADADGDGR